MADGPLVFNLQGTSLSQLPAELHNLIYSYWKTHKRIEGNHIISSSDSKDMPSIKSTYNFKKKIGQCGIPNPERPYSDYGTNGIFEGPQGVCLAPSSGNILVCDGFHSTIQVFLPGGTYLRSIDLNPAPREAFGFMPSMAFGLDGNLICLDQGRSRVVIVNPETGDEILSFGSYGSEPGQFQDPWGVAVDFEGRILVTDSGNFRIQFFTPQGIYIKQLGTGQPGTQPEWKPHRVQVFDPTGKFMLAFGTEGNGDDQFDCPSGITTDKHRNIIVADVNNDTVKIFTPEGKLIHKITNPYPDFNNAADGQLIAPVDIVLDENGDLIIVSSNLVQIFG